MPDNRKRMYTGLAIAAGAVGVYFGARALKNWRQRREVDAQHYARFQTRARYPQETRGERTSARGTPVESQRVEGTRYQPHTQPDRQPIPTTGEAAVMDTAPVLTPQPVTTEALSSPLAQYLITFQDLMQQLRARRTNDQANQSSAAQRRSLTPTDRGNFEDQLDRLRQQMPEVSDGDFADNTLEQRMYNLVVKVRDALENPNYTDDDLFRINGEVRSQACQVLNEVLVAGQDVRQARQLYECG